MNNLRLLNALLIILGGGFLLDVLNQVLVLVWNNKDNVLATVSSIAAVLVSILRLIPTLSKYKQEDNKKNAVKITIEINGEPLTIEPKNGEDISEIVSHFAKLHPQVSEITSPSSNVKVTATIPRKRKRKVI